MSAAFIVVASVVAGVSTPARGAEGGVVAKIGEQEIKLEELKAAFDGLDPAQKAEFARNPALLGQAVRELLVQRLVLKEAVAKNWDQRPEVIAQLSRVKDAAIVESYLQSVAQPPAAYPSEAEIKAAYEAAKANLKVPKQWHLAQIFISAPEGADKLVLEAAQLELESVKRNLKAPNADFAAIARAQSDEKESAIRGGEIGWLAETQIIPELRKPVMTMSKGAISEPIRLADGWHILRVLDIRPERIAELEEVKAQLSAQLRAERTRQLSQAFLAKVLRENPVSINEIALTQSLLRNDK